MSDGDTMLSLEEAMKELQVERDEMKELLRQNSLRYILEEGKIKIPKMALMALKLQRMTSSTQQFQQMKRAKRKKEATMPIEAQESEKDMVPVATEMQGPKLLSCEEALQILKIDRRTLDHHIAHEKLRTVIVSGEMKIPHSSIHVFQTRIADPDSPPPLAVPAKKIPAVNRVY